MRYGRAIYYPTLVITLFFIQFGTASPVKASSEYRDMCTKFVHADTGKGKKATLEKPAKDLGNIISKLESGDVVCIAEGEYTGRGKRGVDIIKVPVSIIGGFNAEFTSRDPWGEFKTIFTGLHNSKNFETQTRLTIDTTKAATKLMEARDEPTEHIIIIDGLIFDNGPRNFYSDESESLIVRKGTSKQTPTPESGALTIKTGINSTVQVKNNVATNFAPTQGVFSLFGGKNAVIEIENNVAINNTGSGFHLGTNFTGDEIPAYMFKNNISMFNQKHTAFGTFGGSGIILESSTAVEIYNSVFAFNDNYGIDNTKRSADLIINESVVSNNAKADMVEFDIEIALDEIEDEAELIDEASDNIGEPPSTGISEKWLVKYMSRTLIDRNSAEEDVKVVESWENDVRSIFGLNLTGTDLNVDSAVWLPRMDMADVFVSATVSHDLAGVEPPAAQSW